MTARYRPTVALVDLDAIRHNVAVLKPAGAGLMAVVKADAYGHGASPVASAALQAGASWLGVALVEEGLGLREAGIEAPILVLSELPPGSEEAGIDALLTTTVYSEGSLNRLAEASRSAGRRPRVHLKVDTGMHRAGVYPPEAAIALGRRIVDTGFELEGLWTHFARAEDEATTHEQLKRFQEVLDGLRADGISPRLAHAANSAATILSPQTHLDLVRTGIAIYGIEPATGVGSSLGLRPALTWRSEVASVRRLPAGEAVSYDHEYRLERSSTIATIPVGYADGYPRALSSRAEVLVGGRRRRVAGVVTMDHIMVDCGDDDVAVGDEAVLLGRQAEDAILAEELADRADTIGYEIVAGIGPRVPREYRG